MNRPGSKILFISVLSLAVMFALSAGRLLADNSFDSPFGVHPAFINAKDAGYSPARDMNVHWDRPSRYVFWCLVQKDLNRPCYDWAFYDMLLQALPGTMHCMFNITTVPANIFDPEKMARLNPGALKHRGEALRYTKGESYLPGSSEKYLSFVKACVERYDGDGTGDMPDLRSPVKYWQVDNEPVTKYPGYPQLLRMTHDAIKEADPGAMVLYGGSTARAEAPVDEYIQRFDRENAPALRELKGKGFEIFDMHFYGYAHGDYRKFGKYFAHVKAALKENGYPPETQIWCTEMGTYSGQPMGGSPFQSERDQAGDIVRRYIYPLSLGVKKVFLAFGLVEGFRNNGGYFDFTGLIYDGKFGNDRGRGVKKLGYYTYKKLSETLYGIDLNSIRALRESDRVFIYEARRKKGGKVWIAWWDFWEEPGMKEKKITLTLKPGLSLKITEALPRCQSGAEVTDYGKAFATYAGEAGENGCLPLVLKDSPLLIEEQ
jgi:hypothetical protein